jgi:LSD1 subclass zinc finger protein
MSISRDLLDILVCPVCKAPLTLVNGETGLKCGSCRRVYPIRDDIPVMLPEEAVIAAEC